MPSQTPLLALPYPLGSDDIRDGDNTATLLAQRIEALLAVPSGFRNMLRNGDMGIQQRAGSTFTTTGDRFTIADGWKAYAVGGSHTIVSGIGTPGTLFGAGPAWVSSTVSGQAAAGDEAQFYQRIESVRSLAGKQVTLSFTAQAGAGTPKIGVEAVQNFGSGGSPSANVLTAAGAITLATTEARYSVTFTVPSITGKTLGTSGTDHLQLTLWLSCGTTDALRASSIGIQNALIYLTDIQLEVGQVATPFERIPQQQQLAWCQRYFYRFTATAINQVVGWGGSPSGTAGYIEWKFPVTMRASPTVAVSAASGWKLSDRMAEWTCTSIAPANAATVANVDLNCQIAGGMTVRAATVLYANSVGAYIEASAEL